MDFVIHHVLAASEWTNNGQKWTFLKLIGQSNAWRMPHSNFTFHSNRVFFSHICIQFQWWRIHIVRLFEIDKWIVIIFIHSQYVQLNLLEKKCLLKRRLNGFKLRAKLCGNAKIKANTNPNPDAKINREKMRQKSAIFL